MGTDTIAYEMADTAQYGADTAMDSLQQAVDVVITVPQSPLQPVDTSLVHLHVADLPVTVWGDTLVKPASLFDQLYAHGRPLTYSLMHDDVVMSLLAITFMLFVLLLTWELKYVKPQARHFFIPSNNVSNAAPAVRTPAELYTPVLLTVIASIFCGVMLFAYAASQYDLTAGIIPPYMVLGVCAGLFLAYYSLRWMLYRFTNWVFFTHSKRLTWNADFSFLSMAESVTLFPILLLAVNTHWNFELTTIVVLSVFGLLRFGLLCQSFRTFFPKVYGLLHLFVYLCTLEIIPLFAMCKALTILGSLLIAK